MQQELGRDKVAIEIVAYGPGIEMLPKIGCVPAGVVQLMQRPKEGHSYIRP